MSEFFPGVPKIQYEGPNSRNDLAFKHYNPEEVIEGQTMRDLFRFSVCYCTPSEETVRIRLGRRRCPALGTTVRTRSKTP